MILDATRLDASRSAIARSWRTTDMMRFSVVNCASISGELLRCSHAGTPINLVSSARNASMSSPFLPIHDAWTGAR